MNNETSATVKATPPLPAHREKQVERVALPQIPAPPRRTTGFSCSALPVGRHSCRTRGCTWNTSSGRDLSSGRCLPAGRSRPCTQRTVGCILSKCLHTIRDSLKQPIGVPSLFTYFEVGKFRQYITEQQGSRRPG